MTNCLAVLEADVSTATSLPFILPKSHLKWMNLRLLLIKRRASLRLKIEKKKKVLFGGCWTQRS